MITENSNKLSAPISKIYDNLGIVHVSKQKIIFNHSKIRAFNVKIICNLILQIPFLLAILSYNIQNLLMFTCTIIFIIIIYFYSKYKYKIWLKEITFDCQKGTINYKRTLPRKSLEFNYKDVRIMSRTEKRYKSDYQYYYLLKKGIKNKKKNRHSLFTDYIYSSDIDKKIIMSLINEFMTKRVLPKELELHQSNI